MYRKKGEIKFKLYGFGDEKESAEENKREQTVK
jgi:hypothetical protein